MKNHFTYPLLVVLFPFFLFAQPFGKPEKVKGVFYIKLTQDPLSSKRINPNTLTVADLQGSPVARKVVPLSRNNPKFRTNKSVLDGLYRVHVDKNEDIDLLTDSLSRFSNVIYAEPVFQEELLYIPNDNSISDGNQPYLDVISIFDAWDITRGSSDIRIGIIDTGIDLDHEDLTTKIYKNQHDPPNGFDDDQNGYVDDHEGYDLADDDPVAQADNSIHGIRVSGIAGADTDNERGIAGAGFNSMLVPLKVFTSENNTSAGNYEAILYAADNGVDVVNLSWGSVGSYTQFGQDIINYAVLEKDMVIVAAAGNQNNEERYFPASYDHVLSIAATNNNDEKASFSSYNYSVDMVAPGDAIFSTTNNSHYGKDNGTSYSTPLVAGAAALLKDHYPHLKARQIMELLRVTSDEIYSIGNNMTYFGKLGKGRLNVLRALTDDQTKSLRAENIHYDNGLSESAFFGDTIRLSFDIVSYLNTIENGSLHFSSASDYVNLLINEIHIGKLDTLDTLSISEQVFVLGANTPPETKIVIRMDFTDGAYQDFQHFVLKTEPDYADFGTENLKWTIAANGNLGYAEDPHKNGIGMEWDGTRILANAGFLMAGGSPETVADNLPLMATGNTREADFCTAAHLKVSKTATSDLMALSTFSDDSAASPMGLVVDQRAFAFAGKDFLIHEYRLINNTEDTIKNVASGLYLNWELGISSKNRSAFDQQNNILISWSEDETIFAGVKTAHDLSPVYQALDLGENYGNSMDLPENFTDEIKHDLSRNAQFDSAGMLGDGNDVANLLVQDSIVIPPFKSRKATFFIALASDTGKLKSLFQDADSVYQKMLSQPVLLETFITCEGAVLELNPGSDSLFRFYSDPHAENPISEGSSLSVGPILQDTSIYVVNLDNTYEGEIQRLDILLSDNVADFSMSTDTLFLDHAVNPVAFSDQSFLADHWLWDFDNGLQATIQNPTVNFSEPGTYNISLYIENELGCTDQQTKKLLVVKRPDKPDIADIAICKNEPFIIEASNADSLAIYRNEDDVKPILESPEPELNMIANDTCLYVTNVSGPFESLKKKVCIHVEETQASFTYSPDTTSIENKAIFVNTSPDPFLSRWYVDGLFSGTGTNIVVNLTKTTYTLSLVNENSLGCKDSLHITLDLQPSPAPDPGQIITCPGTDAMLIPTGGEFFAFYADPDLDSLIKKGRSLRIDSVTKQVSVYVSTLDSLLPSPAVELEVIPEIIQPSIIAIPDTLIFSRQKTAAFEIKADNLFDLKWFKNGIFQESLDNPVLFFDSTSVYEVVLQAETALGCLISDTLHYQVIEEEIKTPLGYEEHEPVVIFPNPSSGIFTIKNLTSNSEVIINNLSGAEISKITPDSSILRIDLSDEKPGMYILTITQHNHTRYAKIHLK